PDSCISTDPRVSPDSRISTGSGTSPDSCISANLGVSPDSCTSTDPRTSPDPSTFDSCISLGSHSDIRASLGRESHIADFYGKEQVRFHSSNGAESKED